MQTFVNLAFVTNEFFDFQVILEEFESLEFYMGSDLLYVLFSKLQTCYSNDQFFYEDLDPISYFSRFPILPLTFRNLSL